ncbi:AAA family ATPase [Corynebacterium flavescens]|uniref:AAA family ATPase n=1 Tax=Corynebacterium flavescens TaxID=28028 RepID=UPI003FD0CC92
MANLKGGMARTTISVMLARAYAQSGKRVVLADVTCDGDSACYVDIMKEKHGYVMPFDVHEFPSDPNEQNYDADKDGAKLRKSIQSLKESMGNNGIVVVDTNSHHEEALRSLDCIADLVVVPYDYSGTAFKPTLRTLDAFTAPTTVIPYRRFSAINEGDEALLHRVVKKSSHLSNAILTRDEKYEICDIPDSTVEYDQFATDLLKQGHFRHLLKSAD